MPGLNLLAENDADARIRVSLLDERSDRVLDCLEHLGGEGAHIVEVSTCVNCSRR